VEQNSRLAALSPWQMKVGYHKFQFSTNISVYLKNDTSNDTR